MLLPDRKYLDLANFGVIRSHSGFFLSAHTKDSNLMFYILADVLISNSIHKTQCASDNQLICDEMHVT